MGTLNRKEPLILFLGDVVILYLSLWLMLFLRYLEIPNKKILFEHAVPFSILFIIWLVVFFIASLYEKHTTILKDRMPNVIFNALIINILLAVLFFYSIPFFGITPKTNLFIYLVITFILLVFWRIHLLPRIFSGKKEPALLVGSGSEMKELFEEINGNSFYNINFISSINLDQAQEIDFQDEIIQRVYSEKVSVVAIDLRNEKIEPILPNLYNLIFSKVKFVDMNQLYEDIFDRVPVSLVRHSWFIENVSSKGNMAYDSLKRVVDFLLALATGLISLIIYPFVILAIKLNDGGPIFYTAERIGKDNRKIKIVKFRTMASEHGGEKSVTRVGNFLRKTRIDELPQLWNVVGGSLSLIGPRPERPEFVGLYHKQVPFYNVRHLIKPGLSGWAQMRHDRHPHHDADTEATQEKLSYDLYYIKNRSLWLDLKIALQTIQVLLSQKGK